MMTIGELSNVIDQNMINTEKRRDILQCICNNISEEPRNVSVNILSVALDTFRNFVEFMRYDLNQQVRK